MWDKALILSLQTQALLRKRSTITKFKMYFTGKKKFAFTFNCDDGGLACTGRRQVLIDENIVVH